MMSNFWKTTFGIALVASLLLEFPADPAPIHAWDYPLFYALTGLLGCLALSFLAKGVLAPALDRPEEFYGEADAEYDWSTESPAAAEAKAARAAGTHPGAGRADHGGEG
jgi:hypothetical protein